MIGYLEGKLLKKEDEKILLLVNGVGYEVLLPAITSRNLDSRAKGDDVALHIWHQQTERQPKPVLIGFDDEADKEFFQLFISVEAIGPLKAVKSITLPVAEIASFIESGNVVELKRLKGIGERTAQKIIATLGGKVEKFAGDRKPEPATPPDAKAFAGPVLDVLVGRLGHSPGDAEKMIAEALQRDCGISTPERLFDEIYKGAEES